MDHSNTAPTLVGRLTDGSTESRPSGTDGAGKYLLGKNHRRHRHRCFRRCYHHLLEVWGRGSLGPTPWNSVRNHPRAHPRAHPSRLTPGVNPELQPGRPPNS